MFWIPAFAGMTEVGTFYETIMYNLNQDQVPRQLPVAETVLLKPWFSSKLLEEGLQIIKEGTLANFFYFRNGTGGLIDGHTPVTLLFENNTKLRQGFTIKYDQCGLCRTQFTNKRCAHLAALAILSLSSSGDGEKCLPLPLLFPRSGWAQIGDFLYNRVTFQPADSLIQIHDSSLTLTYTSDDGGMDIVLPENCRREVEAFRSINRKNDTKSPDNTLFDLRTTLSSFTKTATEIDLGNMGGTSKGWQRDHSFWMWLVSLFHMIYGEWLPQLLHDSKTGLFQFIIGDDKTPFFSLTITLPRNRTWEFIQKMSGHSIGATILPPARECFDVSFDDHKGVIVCPSLRLNDQRIIRRQDLKKNRFSTAYYLDGEGFLPVTRCPQEGEIRQQRPVTDTNPLFAFPGLEQQRDLPFSVAVNEIEDFLENNRQQLRFRDNIVDPALLQLEVRELPDRLYIDSYEEENDWCYISFRYGLGNTSLSLDDIIDTKEKERNCVPGQQWLKLDDTPLSWLHDQIEERLTTDKHGRSLLRLSRSELMALTAVIPDTQIQVKQKEALDRLNNLFNVDTWYDSLSLSGIPEHLRSYQRTGLAWLNQLYMLGLGGLLADDMGLGKTHQGLGLLQLAIREQKNALLLVICPASVLLHWASKIDTFYDGLNYSIYYGQNRNLSNCVDAKLILTTYGVVRQDSESLNQLEFDIILFDEIQNLKNKKTSIHQAAAALKSRIKIGLTGTPIENSLTDLHALFDICMPGFFGSVTTFNRQYVQPIVEEKDKEVKERLGRLIHPFILRRNRKQVLTELPDIIEDNRTCTLSDDQISLYRQIIDEQQDTLDEIITTQSTGYIHILATITKLKQVCNHPCLLEGCSDHSQYESGKWNLFVELLSECLASQMKVVVFSQYTGMLDIIEKYLGEIQIGFAGLRGNMPANKRQKMIERFNNEPDCRIFCASLLAGGVGIDLTAAQAVIHYDRWWNPAKEEQATARVHRMGQKNVVQLFRLITVGTLEEKIHRLLSCKQELVSSIIKEDEASIIKQMDRQQLQELFHFNR